MVSDMQAACGDELFDCFYRRESLIHDPGYQRQVFVESADPQGDYERLDLVGVGLGGSARPWIEEGLSEIGPLRPWAGRRAGLPAAGHGRQSCRAREMVRSGPAR